MYSAAFGQKRTLRAVNLLRPHIFSRREAQPASPMAARRDASDITPWNGDILGLDWPMGLGHDLDCGGLPWS